MGPETRHLSLQKFKPVRREEREDETFLWDALHIANSAGRAAVDNKRSMDAHSA